MNEKVLIGSIFAVALLLMVSFSNVVGYNTIKTSKEELNVSEYDFEYCKDYLFETILEISKNLEIKEIIKDNYKPQKTILPYRRNNVELNVEHLELLYNLGIKLTDEIDEDKVEEFMENLIIDNEIFEQMDKIVMSNDKLRERIYTLNKMNSNSETLDWEYPIICGILEMLLIKLENMSYKIIDFLDGVKEIFDEDGIMYFIISSFILIIFLPITYFCLVTYYSLCSF